MGAADLLLPASVEVGHELTKTSFPGWTWLPLVVDRFDVTGDGWIPSGSLMFLPL